MLKVLSYSCRFQNVLASHSLPAAVTRSCTESTSPLLRALNSFRSSNYPKPYIFRAFCSDSSSSDGSDSSSSDGGAAVKAAVGEVEDADAISPNAILPTVFRPDECFTVLSLSVSPHFQFLNYAN